MKWNGPQVKEKYDIASDVGDIIKLVGKATSIQDNFQLYEFVDAATRREKAKPVIAINMGVEGQMSRILNITLTPVTHPLLPTRAAPGQLSFKEIQQALHLLGLSPRRRFFIFGTPIAHSMSPTLHNTGFKTLGLSHVYERFETAKVDTEIEKLLAAPDFGGASVTIPHKIDIIRLLDSLSPTAKAIGAVNTVILQPSSSDPSKRILHGDNTDWSGIRDNITPVVSSIRAALVIGAGGTARAAIYALQDLKAPVIYIYNRTTRNAEALAAAFPDAHIQVLQAIEQWPVHGPPNVIISTVPSTAMVTAPDNLIFPLSKKLFEYREAPAVVIDMSYKTADTALLNLAKSTADNWIVVPGIEVLLAQGYVQFERWTMRRCPKHIVAAEVKREYFVS